MDFIWEEFDEISVSKVVKWVATLCMIFGGMVPYVPQYCQIRKTENADGFSLYVCLALLLANTLRIMFWFGRRFELPLLLQSILMNITMLFLIRVCVRVRSRNSLHKQKERLFLDFDPQYFWRWTDFQSYTDFMLLFSVVSSAVTYLLLDSILYIEIIGFMAVFIEAMLGMPQLLQNYKNKSTQGMSVTMVMMWMSGDIFKTVYFVAREAPAQFWLCGVLQITVDVIILLQVHLYSRGYSLVPDRKD